MKHRIIILFAILFTCAFAYAQHPFEVKVNIIPNIYQGQAQFSMEYSLSQRLGLEGGIGFFRESRGGNNTPDSIATYISSRTRSYFLQLKKYSKKQQTIGTGFNYGLLFQYEHLTEYKRNDVPIERIEYGVGLGADAGYKWLIWKKLVAEMGAQFIFSSEYLDNPSDSFPGSSLFDMDLRFIGRIGYRF